MKEPVAYVRLKFLLYFFFGIIFRPVIVGKEKIPKDGPVILAGNHTHFMDCLTVANSTKRCVHFLAKSELMKPPLKWVFGPFGIISVDRNGKDRTALHNAINVLKAGMVIGVFPEGGVNEVRGKVKSFKYGAVKMAQKTDAKIVPFAISGKYKILRKSKSGIKIEFFDPITVGDDLDSANDILWETVNNAVQEAVKERPFVYKNPINKGHIRYTNRFNKKNAKKLAKEKKKLEKKNKNRKVDSE